MCDHHIGSAAVVYKKRTMRCHSIAREGLHEAFLEGKLQGCCRKTDRQHALPRTNSCSSECFQAEGIPARPESLLCKGKASGQAKGRYDTPLQLAIAHVSSECIPKGHKRDFITGGGPASKEWTSSKLVTAAPGTCMLPVRPNDKWALAADMVSCMRCL